MFNLKDRRIELGLTMKEVANKVGVSESAVSRWENGDIDNMRRDRIAKLAKALDISPYVLICDDTEEKKEQPVQEDELSEVKRKLIELVKSMPEEKAAAVLALLQS